MAQKTPIGDDMPRMVPDRDDIRRRSQPAPEKKPTAKPREPSESKSSGGTSWLMVLLLVIAGGAIGYLALQQYSLSQLLNSYEERLELADDRIVSLERALTETDESVAMNGTAINAQFKAIKSETDMQMSEIRKLWDVANKRNREWIEANQATLATQQETLSALSGQIAQLESGQASDEQRLSQLTQQLESEQAQLEQMETTFASYETQLDEVSAVVEDALQNDYEERLLSLTLTQENLLAEQGTLQSTVNGQQSSLNELQSTLTAIDTGRQETNARLSALRSQLDSLESRVTALAGPGQ
ncbi:hypothetical protein [Reinekea blandensis]|uniref:Chromosome segregation ATPase n=1 Tax=Reinekea blandensis MED297 TaxID=314283 RepID=A4BGS8_9GAMM|nr:hypothetical protein [Reinekea blandensis]EAR08726.1 hypothetical protein MED297_14460 [Reinekea sp. MED297] [Reinekea blandensis MED297]